MTASAIEPGHWSPCWRRVGTLVALLAVLLANGSHWVALQAVAFGSMIVRYAQEAPLAEAIAMTFDGQHPCPLCHAVQQGRQQEEKQRPQLGLENRFELGLPATAALTLRWCPPAWDVAAFDFATWHSLPHPPPKPPPKPA
ncbi:MAG: hypothetical protein HS113_20525 [Verrucomicrobiales bacterium]|nr:hypothetical protein [Verrucomicrobiales bacterium]